MGLAQTNAARKTPSLPSQLGGRRAWRTSQAHGKQEKAGTTDFFASPGRYLVLSMLVAFGKSSAMELASDTQFGRHAHARHGPLTFGIYKV
jgi:hypothetical protein